MDPVTQTLLGAAAAASVTWRGLGRRALLPGAVGGELPDADVFLPPLDPALPMELHRHFTHSLAFIPVCGALAAAPFMLLRSWRRDWRLVAAAATVGGATHAPLDSCTSYGTHLLWPFSGGRVSWDVVSIVDPIFTLVLLAGVAWTIARATPIPARICLALAVSYLGLGAVQHGRARALQHELAVRRGHQVERGRVMPTLGNLVVWRSIYEADGRLFADALRVPPSGPGAAGPGAARAVAAPDELPAGVTQSTPRIERVRRGFALFADDYLYVEREGVRVILVDARYSLEPGGFVPLWGLEISVSGSGGEGGELDARMVSPGIRGTDTLGRLWRDVREGTGFTPLERP